MRTLGTGLMIFGLFAALVAVVLLEMRPGGGGGYLDFMFFGGIGLCLAGAILFTVRVAIARRRSRGR